MYPEVTIPAVIVATLAALVIGSAWYSPALFGKQWQKLVSMTHKPTRDEMMQSLALSAIVAFIIAFVLANFIARFSVVSAMDGGLVGFLAWLGFAATTTALPYIYSPHRKPKMLYIIENGNHLVSFVVMGIILAMWQ
jgi:hypothetical protein